MPNQAATPYPDSRKLILAAALLVGAVHAQWSYKGCDNVTDADFTVTPVVSRGTNDPGMYEPMKMAFAMGADGTVDIYYVQRHDQKGQGVIKRYDGRSKTVSVVGAIPVHVDWEDGLTGIALDPEFAVNNRIYLVYGHATGWRISRFTLKASDRQLDVASEKLMITVPVSGDRRQHTGGAMQFDAYGDLWISLGDNKTNCEGPGNTADLRGGILRIHPEEDGTYSIPKGNMWEFAAAYFRSQGKNAIAEKYLDATKMKREIYVKGTRNSMTLSLDPVRRWAAYGDCGPDWASKNATDPKDWTEEHNVVTEPSFMGWPYWSATQHPTKSMPYTNTCKDNLGSLSPEAPINQVSGVPELLPAKPATYPYAHSCAMTGPIFRYDGRLPGTSQLPPHFNRIWFTSDFNNSKIHAVRLDDKGKMVGESVQIFQSLGDKLKKPLDFQQGPDGALYFLSYTCDGWRTADGCTGIYRISYKGTCKDPALVPEVAGTVGTGRFQPPSLLRALDFDVRADAFLVSGAGTHRLEAFSLEGRSVFHVEGRGPGRYPASQVLGSQPPGIYQVRLATPEGASTWAYPHLTAADRR